MSHHPYSLIRVNDQDDPKPYKIVAVSPDRRWRVIAAYSKRHEATLLLHRLNASALLLQRVSSRSKREAPP